MKKIIIVIITLLLITGCKVKKQETEKNDVKEAATENKNDIYSTKNIYKIDNYFYEKHDGVDYGTLESDVTYYSKTAKDYKNVNIILPPGYNEDTKYPVLYYIHGWGGKYSTHIKEESYMHLLYGNMYAKNLVKPMIIVGVDMYTDILEEKDNKTDEELRFIYDKVIDDIPNDLMPFIESNYSVKTGRENTAVAGISQGGSESLATGFKYLDKYGYIASLAPDTGVIPTEWFKGTFWNTPIFNEFPMPTKENTPYYIYLAVGSKDPWNIECTKYYGEVLTNMGIKNQTDFVEGYGHNIEFWRLGMYNFMYKIFKEKDV